MGLMSLVFIAVGLSMDAFAVSVTSGIIVEDIKVNHALKVALYFGIFQALMPIIGWSAGSSFSSYIIEIDHWVAFGVLGYIGGKMIYESLKKDKDEEDELEKGKVEKDPVGTKTLLILAIATSIDALAVGTSFSFLNVAIFKSSIIIGCITFLISFLGVACGKKCGILLQKKAEMFGGIILALIGLKIFIEHTGITAVFKIFK